MIEYKCPEGNFEPIELSPCAEVRPWTSDEIRAYLMRHGIDNEEIVRAFVSIQRPPIKITAQELTSLLPVASKEKPITKGIPWNPRKSKRKK